MSEKYYNEQNILNLPKIESINSSDYLIVQNANENTVTSLLPFKNFIIGLENTTFASTIQQQTNDINTLNMKIDELSSFVHTNISSILNTINTIEDNLSNLSSAISALQSKE